MPKKSVDRMPEIRKLVAANEITDCLDRIYNVPELVMQSIGEDALPNNLLNTLEEDSKGYFKVMATLILNDEHEKLGKMVALHAKPYLLSSVEHQVDPKLIKWVLGNE